MELFERFATLGPPGLICVVLMYALYQSEKRESKKDVRIQLLENQLRESFDERILAADRLSDALHGNAKVLDSLIGEIRSGSRKS